MTLTKDKVIELYNAANLARESAYAPYSHFSVGAAVLTDLGEIYVGANIENSSYPTGICAERVALCKVVNDSKTPLAIAIVGGIQGKSPSSPCPPCGICLQFMTEFMSENCPVVLSPKDVYTLGELLPIRFQKEILDDEGI